jgi:folate-dependent phosphoribosylglycinamide formyltransferase PurN
VIIGITSDSRINEYAASLVTLLASHGHAPIFIIRSRGRSPSGWRPRLRRALADSAAGARLRRYRSTSQEATRYLRAHVEAARGQGQPSTALDWPLTRVCEAHQMKFFNTGSMNDSPAIDFVRDQGTDLLINAGGGIFKHELVQAPRMGILNAHMGSLPAFRGINVLEWSLFNDQPAGVTVHFIDRGIDTGDVLLFGEIRVETTDTISTLRAKALVTGVELIVKAVGELASSGLPRTEQRGDAGRQYFAMHPRLKQIVEDRLHTTQGGQDGPT